MSFVTAADNGRFQIGGMSFFGAGAAVPLAAVAAAPAAAASNGQSQVEQDSKNKNAEPFSYTHDFVTSLNACAIGLIQKMAASQDPHYVYTNKFIVYGAHQSKEDGAKLKEDGAKQKEDGAKLKEDGAKQLKGRAIILGADFIEPINDLANIFEEVVVVNYNANVLPLLANKEPKVKTQKIDMTDDVLAKVDAILNRLGTSAPETEVEKAVMEIGTLFKTYKPHESAWAKQLGQADYVVSSLVATQLDKVHVCVNSFFKTHYGINLNDHKKFADACDSFTMNTILQHFRDLYALSKSTGKVYFSDSIVAKPYQPLTGTLNVSLGVPQATLDALSSNFTISKHSKWHWQYEPRQAFEIQGFLMTKKDEFKQIVWRPLQSGPAFQNLDSFYSVRNAEIREYFTKLKDSAYAGHIEASRKMMIQGMQGLKGRAIVLGVGLLEPIPELAANFPVLELVDYDKATLEAVQKIAPKAICRQLDLSGGVCGRIDAILQQHSADAGAPANLRIILGKIMAEFQAFTPRPAAWASQLGEADYVISSLVASQLPLQIIDAINAFFIKKFNVNPNQGNSFEDYRECAAEFKHLLAVQHFLDLHTLSKEGGRVYFADTIQVVPAVPNPHVANVSLVADCTLEQLPLFFGYEQQKRWQWLVRPGPVMAEAFDVHAFLMKKHKRIKPLTAAAAPAKK